MFCPQPNPIRIITRPLQLTFSKMEMTRMVIMRKINCLTNQELHNTHCLSPIINMDSLIRDSFSKTSSWKHTHTTHIINCKYYKNSNLSFPLMWTLGGLDEHVCSAYCVVWITFTIVPAEYRNAMTNKRGKKVPTLERNKSISYSGYGNCWNKLKKQICTW